MNASPLLTARDYETVRLIVATGPAKSEGRLSVYLPSATRLVMLKADGSPHGLGEYCEMCQFRWR